MLTLDAQSSIAGNVRELEDLANELLAQVRLMEGCEDADEARHISDALDEVARSLDYMARRISTDADCLDN